MRKHILLSSVLGFLALFSISSISYYLLTEREEESKAEDEESDVRKIYQKAA